MDPPKVEGIPCGNPLWLLVTCHWKYNYSSQSLRILVVERSQKTYLNPSGHDGRNDFVALSIGDRTKSGFLIEKVSWIRYYCTLTHKM